MVWSQQSIDRWTDVATADMALHPLSRSELLVGVRTPWVVGPSGSTSGAWLWPGPAEAEVVEATNAEAEESSQDQVTGWRQFKLEMPCTALLDGTPAMALAAAYRDAGADHAAVAIEFNHELVVRTCREVWYSFTTMRFARPTHIAHRTMHIAQCLPSEMDERSRSISCPRRQPPTQPNPRHAPSQQATNTSGVPPGKFGGGGGRLRPRAYKPAVPGLRSRGTRRRGGPHAFHGDDAAVL